MSIVSFNTTTTGQIGIFPRLCELATTDNLATITTAGYLNRNGQVLQGFAFYPTDVIFVNYSYVVATNSGTFGIFLPSIAGNGQITLTEWANPGDVLLPVVSGDFAVFNGTSGQIKDAGYLPSNAAKTNVVMANGATIANHIGTFTDTAGTLGEDAATAINGGNIQAGLSGTAGTIASFPATAANGSLVLAAVNAGGAFNTTISNSVMGQSTVYSLADIGATTGGIPVATTALRVKSVAGAAAAGGAAAQSFSDAFCTSASNVIGNWNTQANAASVLKIVPGNGSFVVTSTADAGVGTFNYIITK
jgi:hypothetical protein